MSEKEFCNLCAKLMEMPTDAITPEMTFRHVEAWDSFLVLELIGELDAKKIKLELDKIHNAQTFHDLFVLCHQE